MKTLRSGLLTGLALLVLGAGLAPGQNTDLEKDKKIAQVGGKYSGLVAVLRVEEDRAHYGEFCDYGYWPGGVYRGRENAPQGYWVWVAPNWFVWSRRHARASGLTQVTGAPNTDFSKLDDWTTAWIVRAVPEGKLRQLELRFAGPVEAVAVVVFASDPRALTYLDWSGCGYRSPQVARLVRPFTSGAGVFLGFCAFPRIESTERVRLFLDVESGGRTVVGVDAVGLLDRHGRLHWATGASTCLVSEARMKIQAKLDRDLEEELIDEEEEVVEEIVEEEVVKPVVKKVEAPAPSRVQDAVKLPSSKDVIENALGWLARHQTPEKGYWDADGFFEHGHSPADGRGYPLYDPGVTGLALLAYLGAGYTHQEGKYNKVVGETLRYLKRIQDREGCFGTQTGHFMYSHIIATLALSEAYGMTRSPLLRRPVEKAVAFILKAQNPDPRGQGKLGWRYTIQPGDNDSSVTAWAVMALKSARTAGIEIKGLDMAMQGARKWVDLMTDPDTGRVGYVQVGVSPVRAPGRTEKWPRNVSESITAAGMVVRVFTGDDPTKSVPIQKGIELLMKRLPRWDEKKGTVDPYYWYYGTMLAFQAGGDTWKKWREPLQQAILAHQVAEGPNRGSWNPVGPWGEDGGRVYMTAILTLAMEISHRYEKATGK